MNKNIIKERDLLQRFSSFLLGGGKKNSGHKLLLESLFFLRQKIDKNILDIIVLRKKVKKLESKKDLKATQPTTKISIENLKDENKNKIFNKEVFLNQSSIDNFPHTSDLKVEAQQKSILEDLSKSICKICVDNVKPILETRKVRKGRITYRIPLVVQKERQEGKAISFLIENAITKKKSSIFPGNCFVLKISQLIADEKISGKEKQFSAKAVQNKVMENLLNFPQEKSLVSSLKKFNSCSIKHKLSEEIFHSFSGKSESVEKRKQLHNLALQNRAYTHFRWW